MSFLFYKLRAFSEYSTSANSLNLIKVRLCEWELIVFSNKIDCNTASSVGNKFEVIISNKKTLLHS